MTADLTHLVQAINHQESRTFRIVRSLVGGTSGAFVLEPGPCVLKFRHGRMAWWVRQGQITVEALRAVDYPAPEFLHIGEVDDTTYWITELVPGTPMTGITSDTLPLLLNLIERTADLHPATAQDWSLAMKNVPLDDAFGWCELISRRSPEAARLVEDLQVLIEPLRDLHIPNDDAVHGDFGPSNVLVANGRITGVVDCEAAGRGTRMYDLAYLRRWATSDTMRDEIDARCVSLAGAGAYALFIAYRLLDGLQWTLQKDAPGFDGTVASSWSELDRIRAALR